ncbi:hypothetical protein Psal006b_03195 [Piscirickettsia salmonis]|uniref:Uncharacterized protein n=2 Tax=Piscirickettsia salmonis TaxID=1238 RepID=A0AAC8VF37_PISSA|nr:hypothetical protein [Piscirickettsia salmonis]AKP74831.1 hypothetical protein PSLF89_3362 [Piscirickettsia salmonis LF-89 = ATCC VR-1361]ALB21222.1 hypothetical protein KU39_34 [Piscirickettsia salmonis]ALY01481.1 hypothetical protein AWE47_00165 [Piscirickettsia salmonis]AMA40995.1 hypothetical protein AWJ11_00170 [Piscirickettsia salmonis]AOS36183.1 hypothetical protein AVM72_13160 [Piscirickettsia salmonis]
MNMNSLLSVALQMTEGELNNLLNNPAIKDKLNEQKTTFGKNSNALKNFFNLRWGHINETAGANTARSVQEKLTPFYQNLIELMALP